MSNTWIKFIIIVCHINIIQLVFVSVGNYPDYKQFDVNLDDCGLRYVPRYSIPIHYSHKCIHNPYENRFDNSELQRLKRNILVSKRIYKGHDVEFGESPWTVYLSFQKSGKQISYCTGSLITFEWIVTAAHCFKKKYDRLLVSGGTNQPMKGQIIEANITTLVINANYTLNHHYDMAVVKLMSKFTRHKNDGQNYLVNTICLPEIRENNENNEKVTVFGFGSVGHPDRKATHMQKTDMTLISITHKYLLTVSTRGDSPSICPGDSGAPLVQYLDNKRHRAVLVATVKGGGWTTDCSDDIVYNKFVPVFKNIDWILRTISNN